MIVSIPTARFDPKYYLVFPSQALLSLLRFNTLHDFAKYTTRHYPFRMSENEAWHLTGHARRNTTQSRNCDEHTSVVPRQRHKPVSNIPFLICMSSTMPTCERVKWFQIFCNVVAESTRNAVTATDRALETVTKIAERNVARIMKY